MKQNVLYDPFFFRARLATSLVHGKRQLFPPSRENHIWLLSVHPWNLSTVRPFQRDFRRFSPCSMDSRIRPSHPERGNPSSEGKPGLAKRVINLMLLLPIKKEQQIEHN